MSEKLQNDSGFEDFIRVIPTEKPKSLSVVNELTDMPDGSWVALNVGDGWMVDCQRVGGVWVRRTSAYYPATMG